MESIQAQILTWAAENPKLAVTTLLVVLGTILFNVSRTIRFNMKLIFMIALGIVMTVVIAPLSLLKIIKKNPANPAIMAHAFTSVPRWVYGVTVKVHGEKQWLADDHKPCVYIANHQSIIDLLAMGAIFPERTAVVAKRSLIWVPIFGQLFWALGNILINRKKHESSVNAMKAAAKQMTDAGVSVWMFPEGTRNRKGGVLPFKKGAFHLAIQAQVPIVPIVFSEYTSPTGFYHSPSKRFEAPGNIHATVLPAIETAGMTEDQASNLAERAHAIFIAHLQAESKTKAATAAGN